MLTQPSSGPDSWESSASRPSDIGHATPRAGRRSCLSNRRRRRGHMLRRHMPRNGNSFTAREPRADACCADTCEHTARRRVQTTAAQAHAVQDTRCARPTTHALQKRAVQTHADTQCNDTRRHGERRHTGSGHAGGARAGLGHLATSALSGRKGLPTAKSFEPACRPAYASKS